MSRPIILEVNVPPDEASPYQTNGTTGDAIRDTSLSKALRGQASVVANMGRIAAHTGREVTFEEAFNGEREYAPNADKFTIDSPPPVQADADGKYPVPQPGLTTKHEY